MKKWILFLVCYFTICLLAAACAVDSQQPSVEEIPQGVQQEGAAEEQVGDLAALYLQVLNDLWDADNALNADITVAGLDLSNTSLTEGERATVALLFGETHGVTVVQGSIEELAKEGYISREPLSTTGSGTDLEESKGYYTYWEDGCHFSIIESENTGSKVCFDAQKWRSSLGAYYFTNCTARRGFEGGWSAYTIGVHAIS